MSAHTPIPWEYIAVQTSIGVCFKIGSREILAGNHGGAYLYDDRTALNPHKAGEQEGNAALIVEAVNNHEKLMARVEKLEKENRVLQIKAAGTLANNLCPEHRDKQTGKPCLACRVEKLEAALKPFTHPDLTKVMSNNVQGDNSPIFGRETCVLMLGDFKRAQAAFKKQP
jgi:hypothetical protein